MIEPVVGRESVPIERLREGVALVATGEALEARAIVELAREVEWDETAEFDVVGTRPIRIGADGTRLVDEHLPAEVAGVCGISIDAAIWLIRDVLNVHARHPRVWHAVQTGMLPLWQARELARRSEAAGLDRLECLQVDRTVGPALGRIGWRRLLFRLRAGMLQAAPDKLRAQAEAARADRYVRTAPLPDDPASSYVAGRLDTADAREFDALLDRMADAMVARGTTGTRDQLRAGAVGLLAGDLADAVALLEEHDTEHSPTRPRRDHQVYVHLSDTGLARGGLADIEGLGPVLADQLAPILGDRPVKVTPVLTINGAGPVAHSHAVPRRIREEVFVRDRVEVFPYSSRDARGCDLDHTVAFTEGEPRQTRPGNLGPLARRAHRAKTHGGWRLSQPRAGVFWWESPRGQVYRVSDSGTHNLTPDDPTGRTSLIEQLLLWELDRRLGEDEPDDAG